MPPPECQSASPGADPSAVRDGLLRQIGAVEAQLDATDAASVEQARGFERIRQGLEEVRAKVDRLVLAAHAAGYEEGKRSLQRAGAAE